MRFHQVLRVRWSRKWGVLAVALALTIALAHYRHAKTASRFAGKSGADVPVEVVSAGSLRTALRVSGSIGALRSATLQAPRILGSRSGLNRGGDAGTAGGRGADFNLVLLTLAKPGTRVKTGDVVAQFDAQNQRDRLDDYRDTVIQLENNVESLMANLSSIKEAHDQSVRSAKADWDKALLDLQTAPALSEIDVEKIKLSVEETEATYKQLVWESSRVEESQQSQIRISQLNLNQAKIELQRAENNVKKMTIESPIDGIAVMASIVRNGDFGQIREGDQIFAGQPFLSIVDPSSMVLNATVNQTDAEKLALGMKAAVHLDAYPDLELAGTLTGIGALAKASTFREQYVAEIPVRIQIEGTDSRLLPDLTGSADIVLQSVSGSPVVPRSAVFEEDGHPFVFVRTPDGWKKGLVKPGLESFTNMAIDAGLKPGDVIAMERPI
jgi:HlyD family secretion protein